MHARMAAAAVAVALSAIAALPASATPQSDFNHVYGEWKKQQKITPCRWSRAELENAYRLATSSPDFQYETSFVTATQREISRWKSGGCAGIKPESVRRKSPLFGLRITKVRGRGKTRNEVVVVRNGAKKTVSLRRASIRNGGRGKAVFPARFKLARRQTAVVHMGCAKGKFRPSFRRRVVWMCLVGEMFRDRGDIPRLADAKGLVVSQRPFGDQRTRPVF
jgi:hypothetical protein